MARFRDEWVDPNDTKNGINNGQQWSPYSDNLSVYDANKIVNNIVHLKNRIVDGTGTILRLGEEQVDSMNIDSIPQESGTNRLITSAGVFNAIKDFEKGDKIVLYDTTGQNTDGAMTQKAVTDNLNALTTDVDNLKSKISLPLGMIFPSAIPLTDANLHLLDGSTISQDGVYSEFVDYLETQISAGYDLTCTQTEFDTDVANTGNCGKFVIDDDAGTIRLPKITRFIQGLDNLTNIGKSLEAGLPNITGQFEGRQSGAGNILGASSEVFTYSRTGGNTWASMLSSTTNTQGSNTIIGFDASLSDDIYGNSDTVQPQATQYPYYIVLATSSKTDVQVDIDNVVTDINQINSNIDKLTPVTLYDFTSDDADINWGYTSGIQGGVTVSDKSFGQFSKLRITAFFVKEQFVFEFPLKGKSVDYMWASASGGIAYDQAGIMGCVVKTNSTQTTFNVITIGYYNTSGWQARNSNSLYFVGKIEGVY